MHFSTTTGSVLLIVVLRATVVHAAATEPLSDSWLHWKRGDGALSCPSADEFTAKVAQHLATPPVALAAQSRITIAARIDAIEAQAGDVRSWVAEVRIVDSAGTVIGNRVISKPAESCGPLSDALALVTAMILSNPPIPDRPPEPKATPPVPTPSLLKATTPQARADASPTHPARTWTMAVEVGPSVALGMLPGLGLAGEFRFWVAPPGWPEFFATAGIWPEKQTDHSANQGWAGIELLTAGAGVCPVNMTISTRIFSLCVSGNVGRLYASGFGFVNSTNSDLWAFDLALGGQVRQHIHGGFFVAFGLRAVVPLLQNRVAFTYSSGETQQVYQGWPVAAVGHLRLGYTFR